MRHLTWTLGLVALLVSLAACVDRPMTVFERLQNARQTALETLVELTKADAAANRAVMAADDAVAKQLTSHAESALSAAGTTAAALEAQLADLEYTRELQLLAEFKTRFGNYRELERGILDRVNESTNLKAQRLAFGPSWQETDAVAAALRGAVSAAQNALTALSDAAGPAAQPHTSTATASWHRFLALNDEILALSRRNSNVEALALSLGAKRNMVAACEESLRAIQDALSKRGFEGTR